MNSAGVTVSDSPTPANLFDEFEEAFQNCLAPLTKEDPLSGINQEELKVNAETNGQRFLELAHRMDAAFLQKRVLLSVQKPELLLMEENHEMRIEISRKDELIKKQTEKLAEWQNTLMSLINRVGSVPAHGTRNTTVGPSTIPSTHPSNHMSMMSGGGPPTSQPSSQSPMSVGPPQPPSGSMNMVGGGGMSQIQNISHMGPAMTMNSLSHQPMMGQQVSGVGSSMGSMVQQGGYQQMNSMSGGPGTMGGTQQQSSMGSMGGAQGTPGPGNMGSNIGGGSGMFHSGGGASGPHMGGMGQSQGGLQGPLAYLEKTTTNIGLPEVRR